MRRLEFTEINNSNVQCKNACFSTTINATDIKLHSKLRDTLNKYFGKNPMKTFIFICIIKDSRKSQPYNLYIYIPICFQFDRNLCKVLPK